MVASRGLTNQAQLVLLSMDIPYRVTDGANQNSTTSALFYGFKTKPRRWRAILPVRCRTIPPTVTPTPSCPSARRRPNTAATNSFLAMMLTDTSLAAAENTLRAAWRRMVLIPPRRFTWPKPATPARNVRFVEFDNAVFENQVVGNYAVTRIDTNSTAFTNLFGLLTGLANFSLATNAFVPGAIGRQPDFVRRLYFGIQRADDGAGFFGSRGVRGLWHGGGTLQLHAEISRPGGLFLSDARFFGGRGLLPKRAESV